MEMSTNPLSQIRLDLISGGNLYLYLPSLWEGSLISPHGAGADRGSSSVLFPGWIRTGNLQVSSPAGTRV
uniref:Uncharacterized protein n=1 Tax=Anolis carolinensis TaxID=28377 RepID=A0A803SNH5_ANOCA